jgi:bifunctional NMN adenylyltransferase/nudix hydrolase
MKPFSLISYIGRFSMAHNGHFVTLRQALELADRVLVLIGSENEPRNIRNPWTCQERQSIIEAALTPDERARVIFRYHQNFISNIKWELQIQNIVAEVAAKLCGCSPHAQLPKGFVIGLIGHKKDHTSDYLNSFPQWKLVETEHVQLLNATDIRNNYFKHGIIEPNTVPPQIEQWLIEYENEASPGYCYVMEEYRFQEKHDENWSSKPVTFSVTLPADTLASINDQGFNAGTVIVQAGDKLSINYLNEANTIDLIIGETSQKFRVPYRVTFHTVDAIVVQAGHVLLIQRKNHPGKNCWAMPGGYLDENESTVKSMIRELREETGLKVPEKVLLGSIKRSKEYGEPNRSTRGRIITHAFLVELMDIPEGLPRVRGLDDAAKAQWIPIHDFVNMRDQMFEDHYMIICDMLGI